MFEPSFPQRRARKAHVATTCPHAPCSRRGDSTWRTWRSRSRSAGGRCQQAPPNPTHAPFDEAAMRPDLAKKIIHPHPPSQQGRSERVMRARPCPSLKRRAQCARITREPARKLPRRHVRTNLPSAASQESARAHDVAARASPQGDASSTWRSPPSARTDSVRMISRDVLLSASQESGPLGEPLGRD